MGQEREEKKQASQKSCKLWVMNKFSKPVEVMWLSEGQEVQVFRLEPGRKTNLDSHIGHRFVFKVDDNTRSSEFVCTGKRSVYFYSAEGKVVIPEKYRSEGASEL